MQVVVCLMNFSMCSASYCTSFSQHCASLVYGKLLHLHEEHSGQLHDRWDGPVFLRWPRDLLRTSMILRKYSGSCSASTEKKSSVLNLFGSAGRSVPGLAFPFPRRFIPWTHELLLLGASVR
jgi:hypothetical protein